MLRPMAKHHERQNLPEKPYFRAHWTIFLPAIIVALLYGGVLLVLLVSGKGDTDLAKIMLLVLMLVVPLLLVRAYLRFASLGVQIGQDYIAYRQGWLRPRWRRLRLDDTAGATIRYGLAGKLLGGGDVVFIRRVGNPVHVHDIARPEKLARQVRQRIRGTNSK